MNRLTIHVDRTVPNRPTVRLLIDGQDVLAGDGADQPNDAEDLLSSGALVPQDPPRRIAFYGCGCGEFGCSNVAGLVVRRGDVVEWTDFRTVTGEYHGALPIDPVPDPAVEEDVWSTALDLPTFRFDADLYDTTVRAAMTDSSWETWPRAVVRHLLRQYPDLGQRMAFWAAREGDAIEVALHLSAADPARLEVPRGRPEALAERLGALLDAGIGARRIADDGLWTAG
ncbi:hypothetical protein ACFFOS_21715 [Nocardioides kongjuensis]|uniref:Uncharacterized protein n=1 Tax=Nocardioides kongjuensis TaxID=349522 RepID=A0A852RWM2_9ACTN|nr:hypothetical protein [Nocardioides kongjuensis]NYD32254.1 hypothetical protein [Nocardioides kongjuensis]